jgi:putative ABC transport system permease protein
MDRLLEYGRGSHWLLTYGRLKDGATVDQGSAELTNLAAGLAEQYAESNENKTTYTWSLRERLVGRVGFQLIMLLGAAGFVLLIVCGNVASLLLARATSRQSEMAIRAAVGASRSRVIRQLLTESLVLALLGGAAGLALAVWGVGILRTSMPADIPRIDQIGVDWWVVGFAASIAMLTGVVFGLAPAFSASRADLVGALKDGKATIPAGSFRSPMRSGLVIAQFALALLLANGAAMMLKSYGQSRSTDLGFDYNNILTMRVVLDGPQYEVEGGRQLFLLDAIERIAGLPGVSHVGVTSKIPLEGGTNTHVWAEDDPERPSLGGPLIELSRIGGDVVPALGIDLLAGRLLTINDTTSANPSALINQEMANRLWPDEDPVGKRFSFRDDTPLWITVAGVVRSVRQWSVYRPPISEMYVPFNLRPTNSMYLVIRSDVDPTSLVAAVRRELTAIDREQPVSQVRAMREVLSGQFARQRFNLILTTVFASVALVLVTAGIYGVMSFFVAQGTRDIGIRMALGSGQKRVLNLVVKRGLALTVIGSVVGLGGVFATMQITRNMLFGLSPIDIPVLAAGTVFIIVVGVIGSLIPALRATKVNPVNALRME